VLHNNSNNKLFSVNSEADYPTLLLNADQVFFSPLTRFMRKVNILLSLLFNILSTLTVSHTCCMDLKSLHELSNIANAFNSAMCMIYNVSLKLLPYHYTGQTNICNEIVRKCHQFLSKCEMNSNNVIIRYVVNRFDRQNITI